MALFILVSITPPRFLHPPHITAIAPPRPPGTLALCTNLLQHTHSPIHCPITHLNRYCGFSDPCTPTRCPLYITAIAFAGFVVPCLSTQRFFSPHPPLYTAPSLIRLDIAASAAPSLPPAFSFRSSPPAFYPSVHTVHPGQHLSAPLQYSSAACASTIERYTMYCGSRQQHLSIRLAAAAAAAACSLPTPLVARPASRPPRSRAAPLPTVCCFLCPAATNFDSHPLQRHTWALPLPFHARCRRPAPFSVSSHHRTIRVRCTLQSALLHFFLQTQRFRFQFPFFNFFLLSDSVFAHLWYILKCTAYNVRLA
ncbi:hypothetical protein C8R43DRAFT_996294 [Mycena crocata]|nr:hypothetical protein C8R43DRAFT_996294 [Mycena crocata]